MLKKISYTGATGEMMGMITELLKTDQPNREYKYTTVRYSGSGSDGVMDILIDPLCDNATRKNLVKDVAEIVERCS